MGLLFVNINDKFLEDVVASVSRSNNLITGVVTDKPQNFKDSICFKDSLIIDQRNFEYPSLIRMLNYGSRESLSEEELKHFVQAQRLFLSISDRLSFFKLSVQDRLNIYYELLLYWIGFLRNNKVDAVFFDAAPHMGWDNILYFIAKRSGIKTFWIERTLLNDRVMLSFDYEQCAKVPLDYLVNIKKDELLNFLGQDYYQSSLNSAWLLESKQVNDLVLGKKGVEAQGRLLVTRIKKLLNFPVVMRKVGFLFKESHHSALFFNNRTVNLSVMLLKLFNRSRINRLKMLYASISVRPEYGRKYLFFSLHYQPERSTCPQGGVFENQLIAIDILAKAVPEDWVIYVKEHPKQFHYGYLKTKHYRNRDFYTKLLSYPNVRLVPVDESSGRLIKDAIFTVTISGSSGWESLLAGKACLVFGFPWYVSCNSCFRVDSIKSCRRAIEEILRKNKNDIELDVLKFLAFYKDKFILSSNFHAFALKSRISYETLVINLSEGICKALRGYYAQ